MIEPEDLSTNLPPGEDFAAQQTTGLEDAPSTEETKISDVSLSGEADISGVSLSGEADISGVSLSGEAEIFAHRLDAQSERLGRTEREIQDVLEALLNQMAALEKQSQQAIEALTAQSEQSMRTLEARIEAAESARQEAERRVMDAEAQLLQERMQQDVYQQAWQSAPLTLRLKFVRELLPGSSHTLQNALKEAAALEELRRRGRDLETWLANYPALFADAAEALLSGGDVAAPAREILEAHPAEILAAQTLHETREALDATLKALGITWVTPAPGDPILPELEVVGEENSPQSAGSVARLRRRGFRFQGRLALPAQVVRAVVSAAVPPLPSLSEDPKARETPDSPPTPEESTLSALQWRAETPASAPAAEELPDALPDWLRILHQRTFGCELPAVSLLTEQVFALKDLPTRIANGSEEEGCALLTQALMPLLPLLGMRYEDGLPGIPEAWGTVFLEARQPLLMWLEARMELSPVAPARGDGFDAHTMEALETRRTVHAKEDETVSKLERIGMVWRARPLFRAQVVRYTTGGSA
jgi:hypothetical protein